MCVYLYVYHNVTWATYITNGYIQRLMFSWSRFFPTFSNERQSGTCSGIIYPFYAHITVCACTYMFMLEFQLVIPYHNRHTHCPRLSPSVMSDLEMVYIQHGTVQDSHVRSLWYTKSGWSSRGVIGLHINAIWHTSNAYMIPISTTVPTLVILVDFRLFTVWDM